MLGRHAAGTAAGRLKRQRLRRQRGDAESGELVRRCVPERIVVVGGGLAGLRTVEELRALGYAGSLTLVGAERRAPYDRPPLSKKVLTGALDDTTLRADLSALGVDARLGEQAVALGDEVVRTDAAEHRFDALMIATGASPVLLPGPGPQRVLRTLDDALSLRDLLQPGAALAIVALLSLSFAAHWAERFFVIRFCCFSSSCRCESLLLKWKLKTDGWTKGYNAESACERLGRRHLHPTADGEHSDVHLRGQRL